LRLARQGVLWLHADVCLFSEETSGISALSTNTGAVKSGTQRQSDFGASVPKI
jgi:hypothetical protein